MRDCGASACYLTMQQCAHTHTHTQLSIHVHTHGLACMHVYVHAYGHHELPGDLQDSGGGIIKIIVCVQNA